jgi:hypothetical protein
MLKDGSSPSRGAGTIQLQAAGVSRLLQRR